MDSSYSIIIVTGYITNEMTYNFTYVVYSLTCYLCCSLN